MAEPASPALSTISLANTVAPPNMDNVHDLMAVMKQTMEALGVRSSSEYLGIAVQALILESCSSATE